MAQASQAPGPVNDHARIQEGSQLPQYQNSNTSPGDLERGVSDDKRLYIDTNVGGTETPAPPPYTTSPTDTNPQRRQQRRRGTEDGEEKKAIITCCGFPLTSRHLIIIGLIILIIIAVIIVVTMRYTIPQGFGY